MPECPYQHHPDLQVLLHLHTATVLILTSKLWSPLTLGINQFLWNWNWSACHHGNCHIWYHLMNDLSKKMLKPIVSLMEMSSVWVHKKCCCYLFLCAKTLSLKSSQMRMWKFLQHRKCFLSIALVLRLVGVWNPPAWSARASHCNLLQQHQRRPGHLWPCRVTRIKWFNLLTLSFPKGRYIKGTIQDCSGTLLGLAEKFCSGNVDDWRLLKSFATRVPLRSPKPWNLLCLNPLATTIRRNLITSFPLHSCQCPSLLMSFGKF